MQRFAILEHRTPVGYPRGTHFDLLLQQHEICHTWALDRLPEPGEQVVAERLAGHRLHYLDYEGPISGGRGEVVRIDGGDCEWLSTEAEQMQALLTGANFRGKVTLTHYDPTSNHWHCGLLASE